MKYDPKSSVAEEFIHNGEILETLEYAKANKNNRELIFSLLLTTAVTFIFFYILRTMGTANLLPSTLSVTTSFLAAYLTFRRSPFFAFVYALNDIVLIILWILASIEDISYLSVIVCFAVFLVNDLYGFISWLKMKKKQFSDN